MPGLSCFWKSPAIEVQAMVAATSEMHAAACRSRFLYLVSNGNDGLGNSRKVERVPVQPLKS